jgi:hypothetical protein
VTAVMPDRPLDMEEATDRVLQGRSDDDDAIKPIVGRIQQLGTTSGEE